MLIQVLNFSISLSIIVCVCLFKKWFPYNIYSILCTIFDTDFQIVLNHIKILIVYSKTKQTKQNNKIKTIIPYALLFEGLLIKQLVNGATFSRLNEYSS